MSHRTQNEIKTIRKSRRIKSSVDVMAYHPPRKNILSVDTERTEMHESKSTHTHTPLQQRTNIRNGFCFSLHPVCLSFCLCLSISVFLFVSVSWFFRMSRVFFLSLPPLLLFLSPFSESRVLYFCRHFFINIIQRIVMHRVVGRGKRNYRILWSSAVKSVKWMC